MSLIKQNGMLIFKPTLGFKYPHFWEYYKQHDRMFWTADEINLTKDVQDYQKASEEERTMIRNIMMLFTQNEVLVGSGYSVMLRIFKPVEVQAMLSSFNAREYTHIENYSLFTETLGLPNSIYSDFLDVPVMSTKTEYLEKAKVRKYEDYKQAGLTDAQVDYEFRRSVARMLAVYAGGTENISLMAQFALLLRFQFENKYPGLCQIVEFSLREETMHGIGNSHLFRDFVSENGDIWDDTLKFDIYEGIREIVSYEHALLDYLNPSYKNAYKRYVEYRADIALKELGMKPNYHTPMPPELNYMNDVVGIQLTDFFSARVTEYTKSVQGNYGDIDYSGWQS